MRKRKYTIYDAFPIKKTAVSSAKDLRKGGFTAMVKKLKTPQDAGRLKWGLYSAGKRKKLL